jgi:hypothetical protein
MMEGMNRVTAQVARWGCRMLVAAGLGVLPGGCSVYDARYAYGPNSVAVDAPVPGAGGTRPARTLVQVVGVRRSEKGSSLPASVAVRLKVENTSGSPVSFDPASLVLSGPGVQRFPAAVVRPDGVVDVAPAGTAEVEAFFPFPQGRAPRDFDLSTLSVRWTLVVGGHDVDSSADFVLLRTAYYDRYPHRVGVGFGRYDW